MPEKYKPRILPRDVDGGMILRELDKVGDTIASIQEGRAFDKRRERPSRLEDGQIVFADGTDWDPGGGKGYYWYDADSDTFNKLG